MKSGSNKVKDRAQVFQGKIDGIAQELRQREAQLERSKKGRQTLIEKLNLEKINLIKIETEIQKNEREGNYLLEKKNKLEKEISDSKNKIDLKILEWVSKSQEDINYQFIREVEKGNLEGVKKFVEKGIDINKQDFDSKSAVHIAVIRSHHEILEFLVRHKANLELKDKNGFTAFHYAAFNDNIIAIKCLIAANCNVSVTTMDGDTADVLTSNEAIQALICLKQNSSTLSSWTKRLFNAAINNNYTEAEVAVKNGAQLNTTDEEGKTALHNAVLKGNKEMIQLLVNNKSNLNITDKSGYAPLHYAAFGDQKDVVKLLLDNECDPTLKTLDEATADELTSEDDIEELIKSARKNYN